MVNRIAERIVRYRWLIIFGFLGATVFFATRLPAIQVDPDIKNLLAADLPARVNLARIEKEFGGTEMVLLVLSADDVLAPQTLTRTRQLTQQMAQVKNVDRVLSLFTVKKVSSVEGTITVDPAIRRLPRTKVERERLRQSLQNNTFAFGNVVAKDFQATAVIGLLGLGAKDEQIMYDLQQLIAAVPGPEPVEIAGGPYVRTAIARDIEGDLRCFLPLGLLIMLVFLFFCFRQLRGVLLPFVVVLMSIIFSMGLSQLLGWKINIVTIILPVILLAVANDYGIHILARYQEENRPGRSMKPDELARCVICRLFWPVVICGVTTIAGLLCLFAHIIAPAQQLGILSSAGVAYALLASLTFIPAMLAILPPAKPMPGLDGQSTSQRLFERMLYGLVTVVTRWPKLLFGLTLLTSILLTIGIWQLRVEIDPRKYYQEGSPVARSLNMVNHNFGGAGTVSIIAAGDLREPALLREVASFEEKLDQMPEVSQTTSIVKILREMNMALHQGKREYYRIPATAAAVEQYLQLYAMSSEPGDLEQLIDLNYQKSLITARINRLDSASISRVMKVVDGEQRQRPAARFPVAGGFIHLLSRIQDAIVAGQVQSLFLSLLIVTLMVMVLFNSFSGGLVTGGLLALSMGVLLGLMGLLNIELNVSTALLSSVMVGVGVDYLIHYLWRYRAERSAGLDRVQAVSITLRTTGRGIIFNALSVIVGFIVVLLSNFVPIRFFGLLVAVSIGSCLLSAMIILPTICLLFRLPFLEGTKQQPRHGRREEDLAGLVFGESWLTRLTRSLLGFRTSPQEDLPHPPARGCAPCTSPADRHAEPIRSSEVE